MTKSNFLPLTITRKAPPKKALIPCILLALYIGLYFVPGMQFLQYPIQVVRCGGLPILGKQAKGGPKYYLPDDAKYEVDPLVWAYFCNEQEALDQHYQPSMR